jgi:hypothetical protein
MDIASPDSLHYQAKLPGWLESVVIVVSFIVCSHGVARRLAEVVYLVLPPRLNYTGLPNGAFGTTFKVWGNRMFERWKALYLFLTRYATDDTLANVMTLYFICFVVSSYWLAFHPPDGWLCLILLFLSLNCLVLYGILFEIILMPIFAYMTFALCIPIWAILCTVKEAVGTLINPIATIWIVRYYGVPYILNVVVRLVIESSFEERLYMLEYWIKWTTVDIEAAEWIACVVVCYLEVFSILGWAWFVF